MAVCVIALATCGLFACRQILGLDVPAEGGSPPAAQEAGSNALACGLRSAPGACTSCVKGSCCAESNACAADPVFCAPYANCLADCKGDPACRSQCTVDHPVPVTSSAPVSALSACLAANCETDCDLTCGSFAGYLSEPNTAAACESCLEQNGCPHTRTCASSADCDAFSRCLLSCHTVDCRDACAVSHEAGVSEYKPVFQDFSGTCLDPCGFGSYWACAGRVGYPVAQSDTLTWTSWVYDASNQAPVAGASLSFCNNCPCPTANFPLLAQAQTGPDGFFTVQIPLTRSSNGQSQFFCAEISANGYLRTFFFPGIPFSNRTDSINDSLGPKVTLGQILFGPSNVQQDVSALGGSYDPGRGMIAAGIFDCLGNPANGVTVSIDSTDPLVVLAAPVDGGAGAGLTTRSGGFNTNGHAVFFNVSPGTYVLTATPPGLSKPVDQLTVNVAAGTVTQLGLFPAP
jgi:hypothetical protein